MKPFWIVSLSNTWKDIHTTDFGKYDKKNRKSVFDWNIDRPSTPFSFKTTLVEHDKPPWDPWTRRSRCGLSKPREVCGAGQTHREVDDPLWVMSFFCWEYNERDNQSNHISASRGYQVHSVPNKGVVSLKTPFLQGCKDTERVLTSVSFWLFIFMPTNKLFS